MKPGDIKLSDSNSSDKGNALVIVGATVIDGVSDRPVEGQVVWICDRRIRAVARLSELPIPEGTQVIEAYGKYVIPGLMNANVHLFGAIGLERLARHLNEYEDVIAESAQLTLKNGITTVFDTWGPRRYLMRVRARVNSGELSGSRVFCAGNIIGFDGPLSVDFLGKEAEVASLAFRTRINAIWVENVGRHLMWLTPSEVGEEVRAYIRRGSDFVKYGSTEHFGTSAGAFLAFSAAAQAAIVDEAHNCNISAQAHATSIEGLKIAVEAGCDLITHTNITGPRAIPETTLEMMATRRTGAVIFPWTRGALEWMTKNCSEVELLMFRASDENTRRIIATGAPILLGTDGCNLPPEWLTDPALAKHWNAAPVEHNLSKLDTGHFVWFKAMEEKGFAPMEMLRAATRNVAEAYGKDADLGTLEEGKLADMVILNENPLKSAENYRAIHAVVKEGVVIDRDSLPSRPVLGRPPEPPMDEELVYVPFGGGGSFPGCPLCVKDRRRCP